jgi:transglutaminase-like putative cysteine protease
VFGGALRSLGIPARLVMGYPPEKPDLYHAWNEIYLDGKWVAVDTTFDAELVKAGKPYSLERDRSKAKIVKIY